MALVAAYRFDESGSVTRNGQIGSEPALEVTSGTVDSGTGILDSAAHFAGGFSTQTLSASAGILASLRSFSVSLWVKHVDDFGMSADRLTMISATGSLALQLGRPGAAAMLSQVVDGGDLVEVAGSNPTQGAWHHLVMTWDNAAHELKFYVDGSLVGTDTDAAVTLADDFTSITLQTQFQNEKLVDMLLIDNTAVDLATVQEWHNSGAGFDPTAGGGGASNGPINLLTMGCG